MTFLSPFLLFLGVLIGVPFIIHLMGERKYHPVVFPSLKFLREIQHDSLKKLHVKQWLILAFRALWIAMLVLALAQPYLHSGKGIPDKGLLIIDKTFSTQHDPGFGIAENTLRSDYVNWDILEYEEKTNIDSFRARIKTLVQRKGLNEPNIIFFSDLQDNDKNRNVMNMLNALTKHAYIIEKSKDNPNTAIVSTTMISTSQQNMNSIEIISSTNDQQDAPVTMRVDMNGKRAGMAYADERGYADFHFSRTNDDRASCVVMSQDDDYPEDNKQYLVIRNFPQLKLLCVDKASEGNYHIKALRAMEHIDITIIDPEKLLDVDLMDYDMIWFSGLYSINGRMIERLKEFGKARPLLLTAGGMAGGEWISLAGHIKAVDMETGYLSVAVLRYQLKDPALRVRKYYTTDIDHNEILWETSNDVPLLIKTRAKTYLLLSPFNFNWNEMGLSPYFTRLLGRTLDDMLVRQPDQYLTGDTIQLPASFSTVTTPAGEKYKVVNAFAQTRTPGFYTIENDGAKYIIAVNIPPEECIQKKISPDTGTHIRWDGSDIDKINDTIRGHGAQTLFFILAALFIMLEMILLGQGERTK